MQSKEVFCLNCDRRVPAHSINVKELTAKCGRCDHVFSTKGLFVNKPQKPIKDSGPSRPSGIQFEMLPGGDTRIIQSWFKPSMYFFLVFCLGWNLFLVVWYWFAFFGQDHIVWTAVFAPVLHVAIGAGLIYCVLAGLLNETFVDILKSEISVSHGPVLCRGNKSVMRHDISAIELEYTSAVEGKDRLMTVSVQHRDGRQIELLSGFEPCSEYIAWQIAHHLNVDLILRNEK